MGETPTRTSRRTQFQDLATGAGFWAQRRKWEKVGPRSARSIPKGELEIFAPSEPVVESQALTKTAKARAEARFQELVAGLVADIGKMSEGDVDAQLADLNRYSDPRDREANQQLREACFRRLRELAEKQG